MKTHWVRFDDGSSYFTNCSRRASEVTSTSADWNATTCLKCINSWHHPLYVWPGNTTQAELDERMAAE